MNKLRVWWIPQVGAGSEAFYVPVQSVEEGKRVMDMLATYDAYQLQNKIKPDYCNTGGLQIYNPEVADYEDWYLETEDDALCDSIADKAMIIGYTRMLRRAIRRPHEADSPEKIARCKEMLSILLKRVDTLAF